MTDGNDPFAPAKLDSAPIVPGARRRLSARAWVFRIAVGYALYAVGCFAIEGCGRSRFQVPSRADVAAVTERKAHIRAEMLRHNRHEEMGAWVPHLAVQIASLLLALLGFVGGPILTFRYLWRKRAGEGIVFIKLLAVAILIPGLAAGMLAIGPVLLAEEFYESRRTGVALPPAPPVTPSAAAGER